MGFVSPGVPCPAFLSSGPLPQKLPHTRAAPVAQTCISLSPCLCLGKGQVCEYIMFWLCLCQSNLKTSLSPFRFWSHRAKILLQHPPLKNSALGFAKKYQAPLGKLQNNKTLAFLAGSAHVETAGASGKTITRGKKLGIFFGCWTHCTLKGKRSINKAARRVHSICRGDLLRTN